MCHEELWILYCQAYLKLDSVLEKNKGLSFYLWQLAKDGVANEELENIIYNFPKDFLEATDPDVIFKSESILSIKDLENI